MHIQHGDGSTKYGPGVSITLSGHEVARAIDAFLVANNINVQGPRTIRINGDFCRPANVYVDTDGFVETSEETFHGNGCKAR